MQTDPSRAKTDRLGGLRVLVVIAARAEFGPELAARVNPLLTGVGPVEAALATGVALQALTAAGRTPELVVSLGSAGSQRLEQGRVYQAASVSWRDVDASPLGFPRGVTPFLDHPVESPLPLLVPDLPAARLSTGADIVTGAAYAGIDADMVDMETFAVLRACQRFGVPLAGFRGISDGAEELRRFHDWTALLPALDAHLADALDRLAAALASGLRPGAPRR